MKEPSHQHNPHPGLQYLTISELIQLAHNPKFAIAKIFLLELSRRCSGAHKTTVAPYPIYYLPARKANATPVSKEQLARFCARRLSAEERVRFNQYLNGWADIGDDLDQPTPEYKKFLRRMSDGLSLLEPEKTAKPSRKLPVVGRTRTLTPEEQLIVQEKPGWTLGEPLGEEQLMLSPEELRGVSVRKLPAEPNEAENPGLENLLDADELSGTTDRRIAELLQCGLNEAGIVKVLQYESLPADLQDIDFEPKFDPKDRCKYYPIAATEEGRKLLERFHEVKIPAIKIRDRIRVVRRKAATVHLKISKHNSPQEST